MRCHHTRTLQTQARMLTVQSAPKSERPWEPEDYRPSAERLMASAPAPLFAHECDLGYDLPTFVSLSLDHRPWKPNAQLDGSDFTSVLFGEKNEWRKDTLLPFWNGPDYSKPGTEIYAGRFNEFKIHWITSEGLIFDGTHDLNYTQRHDPPLVFNVNMDPQETYPVTLPAETMSLIEKQKEALSFHPAAIDPTYGMKWALCCNKHTNCTCNKPVPIMPV